MFKWRKIGEKGNRGKTSVTRLAVCMLDKSTVCLREGNMWYWVLLNYVNNGPAPLMNGRAEESSFLHGGTLVRYFLCVLGLFFFVLSLVIWNFCPCATRGNTQESSLTHFLSCPFTSVPLASSTRFLFHLRNGFNLCALLQRIKKPKAYMNSQIR